MDPHVELSAEQIRTRVDELLHQAGLVMEAQSIPARTDRAPTDWDKRAGHFRVCFKPHTTAPIQEPFTIEYSMGEGHRVWKGTNYLGWSDFLNDRPRAGNRVPFVSFKWASRRHLWEDFVSRRSKFPNPHAADVLYSIVLDAGTRDMAFSEWCHACGYDTDSIKARRTWMTCVELGHAARRLFSGVWDDLVETLSDY